MHDISPEGRERLVPVIKWLERGAPHEKGVAGFDMGVGVLHTQCGAVCCIAGALCQFNHPFNGRYNMGEEEHWDTVVGQAIYLLGVSVGTARELFRPEGINDHITPTIAAATLRHFLATGEIDWPKPNNNLEN